MSAEVIPLDDMRRVVDALAELCEGIESGAVRGLALVAIHADGGFIPIWGGSRALGPHGGSILRGAVCWLGAELDVKARRE